MGISKYEFKAILTSLRDQYDYDKARAEKLSNIYGSDVMPSNNSRLTNAIFKILHKTFPPKGYFCAIQSYCYDFDFGRSEDVCQEASSEDELWDFLVSEIQVVDSKMTSDE